MMFGRANFASGVLTAVGVAPTGEDMIAMLAWMAAENTKAAFNPLGTTQNAEGATNYNATGVKHYPDWKAGIAATAATLTNGKYGPVLAALAKGTSADEVAAAVVASPWGTGANIKSLVASVRADPTKYDQPIVIDTKGTTSPAGGKDEGFQWQNIYGIPSGGLIPKIDPLEAVAAFLKFFTSWDTWRRVLLVVGGAAAVIVGVLAIAGDNPKVQQAAELAALA